MAPPRRRTVEIGPAMSPTRTPSGSPFGESLFKDRPDAGRTASDSATKVDTLALAPLPAQVTNHSQSTLADGRVLVCGGSTPGKPDVRHSTTWIYDPPTDEWTRGSEMPLALSGHAQVTLTNGNVLVCGGTDGTRGILRGDHALIYDPTANQWATAPPMATPRQKDFSASALADGRALVTGPAAGMGKVSLHERRQREPYTIAELYDPADNSWSRAADMPGQSGSITQSTLPNGRVLVCGRGRPSSSGPLSIVHPRVYDPASNTAKIRWKFGLAWKELSDSKWKLQAGPTSQTTLADGRVLLIGVFCPGVLKSKVTSALFDITTTSWEAGPHALPWSAEEQTPFHTASLLPSGDVIVCQGSTEETPTVAVYRLPFDGAAPPTSSIATSAGGQAWEVKRNPSGDGGSGIRIGDTVQVVRTNAASNTVIVYSGIKDTYAVCAADAVVPTGRVLPPPVASNGEDWYHGDSKAGTWDKELYNEVIVPDVRGAKASLQTFTGDPRYDDCTLEEHRLADYIHNGLLRPATTPAGLCQVRVAAGTVTVRACGDFDGEYTRDYDPSRGQCYRHPLREDVGIWLEDESESEQARRWVLGMLDRCARFFTARAPSRDESGPLRPPERGWCDAYDGRAEAMTTTFTANAPHVAEAAGAPNGATTAAPVRNVVEEATSTSVPPSPSQSATKTTQNLTGSWVSSQKLDK
eukprot:m.183036 g.183036  ORF g.183036 m.183036 type:complete len:696 (+) comp14986_c0_seq1:23-2110(+)